MVKMECVYSVRTWRFRRWPVGQTQQTCFRKRVTDEIGNLSGSIFGSQVNEQCHAGSG
jgi:hypothetical protein